MPCGNGLRVNDEYDVNDSYVKLIASNSMSNSWIDVMKPFVGLQQACDDITMELLLVDVK